MANQIYDIKIMLCGKEKKMSFIRFQNVTREYKVGSNVIKALNSPRGGWSKYHCRGDQDIL